MFADCYRGLPFLNSLVRPLLCVGAKMFLEIAERREKFGAAAAVEGLAVV